VFPETVTVAPYAEIAAVASQEVRGQKRSKNRRIQCPSVPHGVKRAGRNLAGKSRQEKRQQEAAELAQAGQAQVAALVVFCS